MSHKTQCELILEYMKRFGSITSAQAMQDIGCMRLASRISDLKKAGYKIGSRTKTGKNRFGQSISYMPMCTKGREPAATAIKILPETE